MILPKTPIFLAGLHKALEASKGSEDTSFCGSTFAPGVQQPAGSERNQKAAYHAVPQFQQVLERKESPIDELDDFFKAFAQWTLCVDALLDDPNQQLVDLHCLEEAMQP